MGRTGLRCTFDFDELASGFSDLASRTMTLPELVMICKSTFRCRIIIQPSWQTMRVLYPEYLLQGIPNHKEHPPTW
jgi:hypothetical protein